MAKNGDFCATSLTQFRATSAMKAKDYDRKSNVASATLGATHDVTCRGTAAIVLGRVTALHASICGCSLVSDDGWHFLPSPSTGE